MVAVTIVGSAEVLIRAVDTGFESDVKRKVGNAVDKADKTVKIKADTKDAEASIGRLGAISSRSLDDISSRLTSRLGPAAGEAKAALDNLAAAGPAIGVGVAAGVAVAGVALAAFAVDGAQKFVALAAEIRGFQRVSGASAEDSSRLVAVLDDLGVSAQSGANAMFLLSKKVADGGGDLAKLGVSLAHAKDGTVDLVGTLLNVADAYAAQPDPAKRAELAFTAFGRSGKDLIPVLEQGRAGLDAFFKNAESGRQIFSQADLDKARKYELAIDDLGDTFRGLQLEAGEVLLPFLTTLAEAGTKTLSFLDMLKAKVGGAFDSLKSGVVGAVGGPLAQLGELIGNVGGKSDKASLSQKEMADQVKRNAAAQQEEVAASTALAAALDKVTNATISALSSQLGYEQSVNTLKDNINDLDDKTQAYNDAVAENGVNSKEAEAANRALRDAHLGIEQSALAAAGASVRLASDQAEAAGASLNAQEKSEIFRSALQELANQADGPSRQAILNLANQLDSLPESKTIDISINTYETTFRKTVNNGEEARSSNAGSQQEFALGMDRGPVRGRTGQAVPIIAHAGEWVLTPEQLSALRRNSFAPSSVTTSTLSSATSLAVTGPLVVVQGSVLPGQEGAIGAAVRQAVVDLVRNGTVGQEMKKRQQAIAR